MIYLLDTDICIEVLRQREPLRSRVAQHSPRDLSVASMTVAELRYGALNGSDPEGDLKRTQVFLAPLRGPLPFDAASALRHAEIRYALRSNPIGEHDLVIASTVLAHNGVLVSHNRREFLRVPGLTVEDWAA